MSGCAASSLGSFTVENREETQNYALKHNLKPVSMFKKKKKSNIIRLVDSSGNTPKIRDSAAKATKNSVANDDISIASMGAVKKKPQKPILAEFENRQSKPPKTTEKVINLTEISLSDSEETSATALFAAKAVTEGHGKHDFLPESEKEEQNTQPTPLPEFNENVFDSLKGFGYLEDLENEIKEKLRDLTDSS